MRRLVLLAALAPFASHVDARPYVAAPADPVALEPIELYGNKNSCERLRGVEAVDGGFRVNIQALRSGLACDDIGPFYFTLGAFPPGTYRVTTRITCNDCSPPVFDEPQVTTITVRPSPASSAPGDDVPFVDLSGIWTTASEPYTAFVFIASTGSALGIRTANTTVLWYDYSGTQPTWRMILLNGYEGTIVRAVPTGTGANRTIQLVPVGNVRLFTNFMQPSNIPYRLVGTLDGREFDYWIERFRWTRYAWPARAPDPE